MRFAILCVVFTACSTVSRSPAVLPAPPPAAAPVIEQNAALRDELLEMASEDQRIRREWINNRDNAAIKAEAAAMNERHQRRIIEIVEGHGWPGKSLVGQKASGAAWTLFQHASPEVLQRYLPIMESAARRGELDWSLVATTIDRVRISEGRPQLYGTQFKQENGKWVPHPVEDETNVDQRRKEVGLQPLAEYAEALRKAYEPQPKKPR